MRSIRSSPSARSPARTGLTRAAAGRFLLTLETLGYVRVRRTRRFALTPRVLELGFSYLSALSLPEIVQPHLEALSREVDESVSAAVLDGADIVYVARVPDAPHHERAHHDRHAVPRLRDAAWDACCWPGCRMPSASAARGIRSARAHRAHPHRTPALCATSSPGCRPGLVARRRRTRAGPALDRRAAARPRRVGGRRHQRLDERHPRHASSTCSRRTSRRCCAPPRR